MAIEIGETYTEEEIHESLGIDETLYAFSDGENIFFGRDAGNSCIDIIAICLLSLPEKTDG